MNDFDAKKTAEIMKKIKQNTYQIEKSNLDIILPALLDVIRSFIFNEAHTPVNVSINIKNIIANIAAVISLKNSIKNANVSG